MFSFWAYILIGNNNTGKTTFQRELITTLCDKTYGKLPRNIVSTITHSRMPRGLSTLFTMNRSFQEKIDVYKNVLGFFDNHFKEADICILSSHAHDPSIDHLREMIPALRLRGYNVAAVFFSNGFADAKEISLLDWDERLWVHNPPMETAVFETNIASRANEFVNLLIQRAAFQ